MTLGERTEHSKLRPHEKEAPMSWGKTIAGNFFNTLRFGQNSPNHTLEVMLMVDVARQYPQDLLRTHFPTIQDFDDTMRGEVQKISLPPAHTRAHRAGTLFSTEEINTVFDGLWQTNLNILGREVYDTGKTHTRDTSPGALLTQITEGLIERDMYYQKYDRPSKPQDPHMSFIRHFILDDEKINSQQFSNLFRRIKPMITAGKITGVDELTSRWENNHPGSRFFNDNRSRTRAA